MRVWRCVFLVVLGYVMIALQSTLVGYAAFGAVMPDIVLASVVCAALYTSPPVGAAYGLVVGLAFDVLYGPQVGFSALQFTLFGASCGLLAGNRFVDRLFVPALLCALGSLVHDSVSVIYLYLHRVDLELWPTFMQMLLAALYTGIAGVVLYQVFYYTYKREEAGKGE